jgi:hypothetical protein
VYCSPVEARCDASKVLEFIEASLDGVSNLIGFEVIRDQPLSYGITGDHRFSAHVGDETAQGI